ncbi:MAG: bifunctional diaminohydroxyphosphoribosylaminopyrimidine deaminase/5-amino-6-(5-phosphoribosylamino)uracil reductase RibD [Deltaproteobacteria bacterium]|nr:MAG: bifunctional diaminohydroxyphosphoribosylaminopyrimidine deaminase/5-amino-6-(5-phosphoribosylamino)uracil reductase RibD [Deltaproteobacteria bacterium]
MSSGGDLLLMELALRLAKRGVGTTTPNPAVGCVIVNDGRIVGHGYHERAGGPHAEVMALREAGEAARGATAYVTLEPCSHHGRTPPCTDALITAGVKRVIAATVDPNPMVAGRGLALLKKAGVEVESGLLNEEANLINEGYRHAILEKRAFLNLKLAATLDGRTATSTGDSKWITSPASRARVHDLRMRTRVVMVGVGTANADDPGLDVRLGVDEPIDTLRVVVDRDLVIRSGLKMLTEGRASGTVIFCGYKAPAERLEELTALGAKVIPLGESSHTGGLDLKEGLTALYGMGKMEVLCEGGSKLAKALLDAGLVNRLHLFIAPKLLGGDGVPIFTGAGVKNISEAARLDEVRYEELGQDLYVTGKVKG